MIETFKNFLSSKGIKPTCSENLVQFRYKDLNFALVNQDSDPYYFSLILPNIYEFTQAEDLKIRETMDVMTRRYKVAKYYIRNENVWLAAEQFVYSRDNINALFDRLLGLLEEAYNDFNKKIRES